MKTRNATPSSTRKRIHDSKVPSSENAEVPKRRRDELINGSHGVKPSRSLYSTPESRPTVPYATVKVSLSDGLDYDIQNDVNQRLFGGQGDDEQVCDVVQPAGFGLVPQPCVPENAPVNAVLERTNCAQPSPKKMAKRPAHSIVTPGSLDNDKGIQTPATNDNCNESPKTDYTYTGSLAYRSVITPDRVVLTPNMSRRALRRDSGSFLSTDLSSSGSYLNQSSRYNSPLPLRNFTFTSPNYIKSNDLTSSSFPSPSSRNSRFRRICSMLPFLPPQVYGDLPGTNRAEAETDEVHITASAQGWHHRGPPTSKEYAGVVNDGSGCPVVVCPNVPEGGRPTPPEGDRNVSQGTSHCMALGLFLGIFTVCALIVFGYYAYYDPESFNVSRNDAEYVPILGKAEDLKTVRTLDIDDVLVDSNRLNVEPESSPVPMCPKYEAEQNRITAAIAALAEKLNHMEAKVVAAGAGKGDSSACSRKNDAVLSEVAEKYKDISSVNKRFLHEVQAQKVAVANLSAALKTSEDHRLHMFSEIDGLNDRLETELPHMKAKLRNELLVEMQNVMDAGRGCEPCGSANSPLLDESHLRHLIKQVMSPADLRPDYALQSSGGHVVSVRCTESYPRNGFYKRWYGNVEIPSNPPETVIQPSVHPGECWAFLGVIGSVVIQLSHQIQVTGVTVVHAPKSILPPGYPKSAPKDFTVIGFVDAGDTSLNGTVLGSFTYDINGAPVQYFEISPIYSESFRHVEFSFKSNHGNIKYTCVYRVQVHGQVTTS